MIGAGADDLIGLVARTFLGPGRVAAVQLPTYPLYAIASGIEGADVVDAALVPETLSGVDLVWVCNPANPTGALVASEEIVAVARSLPDTVVVVDEAYFEYAGETVVPFVREQANLVAIRSLSKAFGFAALRVGYAVACAETAAELERRRAPAPVATPAARIAAAALRAPVLDVESEVAERERMREALLVAGYACPPSAANFVYVPVDDAPDVADRLEAQGLVVRRYSAAIRVTPRTPSENDRLLAALGAGTPPSAVRSALVVRTTAETSLRIVLALDGRGRTRIRTGVGFLDHLLALFAFHGGLDLEVVAGGDLDVDEHHTVEDVLAALGTALSDALGAREGVARYGAATVPMDEARATAAVDLVRRPHAEIAACVHGRASRRTRADAPAARPRAVRDRSRLHGARRGVRNGRPPRRRGGVQGARPRARGRVHPLGQGRDRRLDEGHAVTFPGTSRRAEPALLPTLGGEERPPATRVERTAKRRTRLARGCNECVTFRPQRRAGHEGCGRRLRRGEPA